MDEGIRIGFVSLGDPNDVSVWSGTPYHLLEAVRRQNVSVEVLGPLKRSFRYPLMPLKAAARLVKKDVEFDRFPMALRSYGRQLAKRLQQRPVDVILACSSVPITMLECEGPIVFYTDAIHHMMPGYYGGTWDRLTVGALMRGKLQEEAALKRCTFAVYSSNWAAAEAQKLIEPGKIRMVPFGASMPVEHDLATLRGWVKERADQAGKECRLLLVGVDWARKGGEIAVEAARLLNEMGVRTKLTVVGCRPEGTVPEFVELLGFVSKSSADGQAKLRELFRTSTFFILPTRAELSAIVYCEASAYGLPILTFKTGGAPDYVRDGINGICLPCDSKPEVFARHIYEILEDKDRYSSLCEGGFNEYKSRLNWDKAASSVVELCREASVRASKPFERRG